MPATGEVAREEIRRIPARGRSLGRSLVKLTFAIGTGINLPAFIRSRWRSPSPAGQQTLGGETMKLRSLERRLAWRLPGSHRLDGRDAWPYRSRQALRHLSLATISSAMTGASRWSASPRSRSTRRRSKGQRRPARSKTPKAPSQAQINSLNNIIRAEARRHPHRCVVGRRRSTRPSRRPATPASSSSASTRP